MGSKNSTTRGRNSSVNEETSANEKASTNKKASTNELGKVLLDMFGETAQVGFGEEMKFYNVWNSNINVEIKKGKIKKGKIKKGQMQYISTDGEHYTLGGDEIYDFDENQIQYLANMLFAVNRGYKKKTDETAEIFLPEKITTEMLEESQKAKEEAKEEARKLPPPLPPPQPPSRPLRKIPRPPAQPPPRPSAPGRSLQGAPQNERAPNGLLGDVPTGTFEQISNAFGDVHTIGYGGSGATFLASLGAYEFLGLIGFLFFFALFVMKGIRACRKKKQWKATESETFQNGVEQESDSGGGYEVWKMGEMV